MYGGKVGLTWLVRGCVEQNGIKYFNKFKFNSAVNYQLYICIFI